jgi:hypothetical protein
MAGLSLMQNLESAKSTDTDRSLETSLGLHQESPPVDSEDLPPHFQEEDVEFIANLVDSFIAELDPTNISIWTRVKKGYKDLCMNMSYPKSEGRYG